ncbi:hypothetical protein HMPREF0889_1334 [Megasphaera lornae]|uniref:Uncharacterized protein n=1 Tax=Megasphaera lornae TaxID=1000568 RepID=D3LUD8_9FIRM|nr:hypothetical protein HMPREF0889_1334 [Megasphaera genomosp. type_1 str. 28L]
MIKYYLSVSVILYSANYKECIGFHCSEAKGSGQRLFL